ncbi:MAG: type I-U CRISPR-associated protein Cas5/Cas6, partial [Thermoleophilia bacterium]
MGLSIEVELLTGTYEAGIGGKRAEWPPHPARLFCALVSVAEGERDFEALRWLERQDPPLVLCPHASESVLRTHVPTNAIEQKRHGATYLGRVSVQRRWARALPAVPRFWVVWPQGHPESQVLASLRSLAARTSYLGRPAGMARMTVQAEAESAPAQPWRRFVPAPSGPYLLRVPYEGYLDALRAAFDSDEQADTVSMAIPYVEEKAQAPSAGIERPVEGPYDRLLCLGFRPGAGVAG